MTFCTMEDRQKAAQALARLQARCGQYFSVSDTIQAPVEARLSVHDMDRLPREFFDYFEVRHVA